MQRSCERSIPLFTVNCYMANAQSQYSSAHIMSYKHRALGHHKCYTMGQQINHDNQITPPRPLHPNAPETGAPTVAYIKKVLSYKWMCAYICVDKSQYSISLVITIIRSICSRERVELAPHGATTAADGADPVSYTHLRAHET